MSDERGCVVVDGEALSRKALLGGVKPEWSCGLIRGDAIIRGRRLYTLAKLFMCIKYPPPVRLDYDSAVDERQRLRPPLSGVFRLVLLR